MNPDTTAGNECSDSTPAVVAKTPVTIQVTEQDIDAWLDLLNSGSPRAGCNNTCPIYFATRRNPELKDYIVGADELYESPRRYAPDLPLPKEASVLSVNVYNFNKLRIQKGILLPMSWGRNQSDLVALGIQPMSFTVEV